MGCVCSRTDDVGQCFCRIRFYDPFGDEDSAQDDITNDDSLWSISKQASSNTNLSPESADKSKSIPNIGPRESLDSLADELKFNKLCELEMRGYVGFRRIRGDGNCFYRAFGFGLLEELASADQQTRMMWATALLAQLGVICFEEPSEIAAHADLLSRLRRVSVGGLWEERGSVGPARTSIGNLDHCFQHSSVLDLAMIRALRRVLADHLQDNAHKASCNESSFEAMCHVQGYAGVAGFCEDVVLPLGTEAEGIVLSGLPSALGARLSIAVLNAPASDSIAFIDCGAVMAEEVDENDAAECNRVPHVHVQLRPGCYDLLYMRPAIRQIA